MDDFIIHHTLVWTDNGVETSRKWNIVHIPTGLRISSMIDSLAQAKKYCLRLNELFPKHGWKWGMPFYQNSFATDEITKAAKEYVQSLPQSFP